MLEASDYRCLRCTAGSVFVKKAEFIDHYIWTCQLCGQNGMVYADTRPLWVYLYGRWHAYIDSL